MALIPVILRPKDSLDFAHNKLCEGCGNCCARYPSFGEMEAGYIQKKTGLKIDDFTIVTTPETENYGAVFTTKRGSDNVHCIFLDKDRRCSIYEVAPQNCKDASCFPRNYIIPTITDSTLIELDKAFDLRQRLGGKFVEVSEIIYNNALRLKVRYEDRSLGENAWEVFNQSKRSGVSDDIISYYRDILLAPYRL